MSVLKFCLLFFAGISFADNPIFQTDFTADPAPVVIGDTVFVVTSHDEDGVTYFTMNEWRMFSSTDMVNWTDRGVPMKNDGFTWADKDAAWASQMVERDGKYYFYVTTTKGGPRALGVAVADQPAGPYKDALGKPIAGPNWDYIDPTVFVDGEQAYLYWGNPTLYYCKLKKSMTECDGDVVKTNVDKGATYNYTEGPWFYKRGDLYYMVYASHGVPEKISYATSKNATGPWEYRGIIMDPDNKANEVGQFAFTIHSGVVDFKNRSFFFYHNQNLRGAEGYTGGFTRSVDVEEFTYNADGTIPLIKTTALGVQKPIHNLDPFKIVQAETKAFSEGLRMDIVSQQEIYVSGIDNGDYLKIRSVDFGADGAAKFFAKVKGSSGSIELHLDKKDGAKIGTLDVKTGSSFEELETAVDNVTGVHDLFLVFAGSGSNMFEFDYWYFESAKAAVPQGPFCGVGKSDCKAWAVPGKIEAEDYDIGGQDKAYYDETVANEGGAYREDRVDIVTPDSLAKDKFAVGYTVAGEWLEYTVNVAKAGVYQFRTNVSSGNDAAGFMLFVDDTAVTDTVKVGSTGDWNTYKIIEGETKALSAGGHVLKLLITGNYMNIDYLEFAENFSTGVNFAASPELNVNGNYTYKVFDLRGIVIGNFEMKGAATVSEIQRRLNPMHLNPGVYLVRRKDGLHWLVKN